MTALRLLVDLNEMRTATAADIIIQLHLGDPVDPVHTNEARGSQVTDGLRSIFEPGIPLRFLQPHHRQEIKGPKESVFNLESKKLFVL